MSPNILRAASGQQAETSSEAAPSSYPTGGFTVSTDLGRVDEAMVEGDDGSWEVRLDSVSSKTDLDVQVFSQDGTGEAAGGTDLSGMGITYDAKRL